MRATSFLRDRTSARVYVLVVTLLSCGRARDERGDARRVAARRHGLNQSAQRASERASERASGASLRVRVAGAGRRASDASVRNRLAREEWWEGPPTKRALWRHPRRARLRISSRASHGVRETERRARARVLLSWVAVARAASERRLGSAPC